MRIKQGGRLSNCHCPDSQEALLQAEYAHYRLGIQDLHDDISRGESEGVRDSACGYPSVMIQVDVMAPTISNNNYRGHGYAEDRSVESLFRQADRHLSLVEIRDTPIVCKRRTEECLTCEAGELHLVPVHCVQDTSGRHPRDEWDDWSERDHEVDKAYERLICSLPPAANFTMDSWTLSTAAATTRE